MTAEQSFKTVCSYLPPDIKESLARASGNIINTLTEIRLYSGRGVVLFGRTGIKYLCRGGTLSDVYSSSVIIAGPEHMKHIIASLSKYSFHSHESELTDGRFVLENGVRAGVCGSYSQGGKGIVRDVSSVNFRIAREVKGCADGIAEKLFGMNILICGAVNSGKTTLLRDLCRLYGNKVKCSLVDERNEISASKNGIPAFDVGLLTDVITGKERHDGIIGAVRTMSPDYIFCDEISDEKDAEAIYSGIGCGTKFAASVHADDHVDLMKRKVISRLITDKAFDVAVFLQRTGIREVRRLC